MFGIRSNASGLLTFDQKIMLTSGPAGMGSGGVMGKPDVEKRSSLQSYNDFAGQSGSGHCADATMPRDIPAGSSRRCELVFAPPNLHGIETPSLENPARTAEYSLTENVASPFQAEPRHLGPAVRFHLAERVFGDVFLW
jgi:hypothetical protein